jgi:SET domain-containing protein
MVHMCQLACLTIATHPSPCTDLIMPAGTYIFRLNADYCVDATRAGNIAHLINHSCAPCCHSRTITVRCPSSGQLRDHVVIVASRDIAVGELLVSVFVATFHALYCSILLVL